MSTNRTSNRSPCSCGGYHGVTADMEQIISIAVRTLEENDVDRVRISLSGHEPVNNPMTFIYEMDRSGALRFISSRPGGLPDHIHN
ncbi:hypothetical protein FPRO05_10716 [Fusarium proliferatum]|uniref:Uncharacterized protein n=1 Tax=Gibberella intermedia TaxID=948311 RepID=A0A365NC75_GIBIN|nr:hypothetical protein FPRO05_10716 [Fusarium proliferatum]